MNYSETTGDWGDKNFDLEEITKSGKELLRLIREWREKLGTKCGLLDDYLAAVLNTIVDTTGVCISAEEGFDNELSELRGILRQIKDREENEVREHPFYPQIRRYMDAHPFPQDSLYYETYCVGLFQEYFMFALQCYMDRCHSKFQAELEANNVLQLREALLFSDADITEEAIDYLNRLISLTFMWITPSGVFMQGMLDQIMYSLLARDKRSGRYVFQRVLDGEV